MKVQGKNQLVNHVSAVKTKAMLAQQRVDPVKFFSLSFYSVKAAKYMAPYTELYIYIRVF